MAERLQLYRHKDAVVTSAEGRRSSGRWADGYLVDAAIAFLSAHREERAFLYLASMTPHTPLDAPEELVNQFRAEGLPANLATLYAMVAMLDAELGRLFAYLESSGMAANTLVIFTSDNGPAINRGEMSDAERGLRKVSGRRGWKGDLWQGGVRVPAYVRWPAGLEPGVVATPIDQADLFPTLLAWCGVEAPSAGLPLDGRDRSAVVAGRRKEAEAEYPIFNYAHPGWLTSNRPYSPVGLPGEYNPVTMAGREALAPADQPISVRLGRFKLLRNPVAPDAAGRLVHTSVLVDMWEDPGEAMDVSARFPERRREMDGLLDAWFLEVRDSGHAFGHPVVRVGAKGGAVAAKVPAELRGGLQNTVNDLRGWSAVGDGAVYALDMEEAGRYRVSLDWLQSPGAGLRCTIRAGVEAGQLTGPAWATPEPGLALPAGRVTLELEVAGGADGGQTPGVLRGIELQPLAGVTPGRGRP